MEAHQQQSWKLRFSFKNATLLVCFLNLITVLLLLHGFFFSGSSPLSQTQLDKVQLKRIMESEEVRRSLEPLELIKRVREIEHESEPETIKQNAAKQTAAVDLSKRLKDRRASNEANNMKALEEWRIRKMERARQRELERNGTTTSQA